MPGTHFRHSCVVRGPCDCVTMAKDLNDVEQATQGPGRVACQPEGMGLSLEAGMNLTS